MTDEEIWSRAAIAEWRRHGIYPPPFAGTPENPAVLRAARRMAEAWTKMSESQRERLRQLAHRAQTDGNALSFVLERQASFHSPPSMTS